MLPRLQSCLSIVAPVVTPAATMTPITNLRVHRSFYSAFYSGIFDSRVVVDCGRVCQILTPTRDVGWEIFGLNISAGAWGIKAESRHEVGITFLVAFVY